MDQREIELFNEITQKTQSELILFFIIAAVVLVVFLLPLYSLLLKDKKEKNRAENDRLDKYIQREREIIQVVSQNTEVVSALKILLENSGNTTNNALIRIHDRIDSVQRTDERILLEIETLKANVRIVDNIESNLQKVLLIVDNLPYTSNAHKKKEDEEL